jgi:hypothetical protein
MARMPDNLTDAEIVMWSMENESHVVGDNVSLAIYYSGLTDTPGLRAEVEALQYNTPADPPWRVWYSENHLREFNAAKPQPDPATTPAKHHP